MTNFKTITKSPEALAAFIKRCENESLCLAYCRGDCEEDDCKHELDCIVSWLYEEVVE